VINRNSGYGFHGMNPNIEIMDYIGRKDRDGKKIYEDSVLDVKPRHYPAFIGPVGFVNGGFYVLDGTTAITIEEEECRIIGNGHENSELLKAHAPKS